MATRTLRSGFSCLILTPICFLIAACSGGSFDSSVLKQSPHTFTIFVYEYLAPYQRGGEDPSDSSSEAPPTAVPSNVWADDELVGVNWEQRTLEYGTSVRDRYGDEAEMFFPYGRFAIEWDGRIIVEGRLIPYMSPSIEDQPVLVFDPFTLCNNERVVVRLHPNHYGDDQAPIAGLSQEFDAEIGEYLSDRLAICPVGR